MQKQFISLTLILLFSCTQHTHAQQPQWELFFPDLSGPIAVDPTDSDIIYIAPAISDNNGMWKTTDGGQTWNFYDEGWGMGTPEDMLIDPNHSEEILVAGGTFVGIIKSTDGGQNWFRADSGLVPDHHGYLVRSIILDNKRRIFYAAHDGIFGGIMQSADGVRWQRVNPNFIALDLIVDEMTGVLYAGAGGVWKSVDGGINWTRISNGLPIDSPTHPISYITTWHVSKIEQSNTFYAATSSGIYKSIDGGDNWFSVNDSVMSTLSFRGGLVVAEKDTNVVFAGAGATLDPNRPGGIYKSYNGGQSWLLYNSGLPDSAIDYRVTNLFLDNKSNMLYASIILVLGGSRSKEHIFHIRNAITTSISEPHNPLTPTQLSLHSYPNPFNNQTFFSYAVHREGRVILQVFDLLGKEVVTLLDEDRRPGEYRITWYGANTEGQKMPSGIYLAKLQVGGEQVTIKLLLSK